MDHNGLPFHKGLKMKVVATISWQLIGGLVHDGISGMMEFEDWARKHIAETVMLPEPRNARQAYWLEEAKDKLQHVADEFYLILTTKEELAETHPILAAHNGYAFDGFHPFARLLKGLQLCQLSARW